MGQVPLLIAMDQAVMIINPLHLEIKLQTSSFAGLKRVAIMRESIAAAITKWELRVLVIITIMVEVLFGMVQTFLRHVKNESLA